ncbi:MAG: acetyl/propionyl/methylcrotonyl-CoA carboxylase subunit alpha [Pseudomonadota bacterium]
MFDRLLIANRGEIACRVIRSAKRLGVETVAVYSDADRDAPHVAQADQAVRIGPAPATESYLNQTVLLQVAQQCGCQAVHPGYGFLAENADFAEACADAGLVFVGPQPAAIRAMGSKAEARALMAEAGVPLVPGYHGDGQDDAALGEAAKTLGVPLLIKPSAGGGGKGMRPVERLEDFPEALAGARREAMASFGSDHMVLERLLRDPRHIEVQVFGDRHGNLVHLFERDCSLQRRHQKVIEEAPAPGLAPATRARLAEAALAAARAVDYENAGTVEFVAEGEEVYFIEMNTRLQVEHPVTEMITGVDLVAWQLRVAAGEPLPLGQDDLAISGHALEARLYAEDPSQGFLPATGRITHLRFPEAGPDLRVDSGLGAGQAITIHYDPMIAKLIVRGEDRPAAVRRLRQALAATELGGLASNQAFLARIAGHPTFAEGRITTGFLAGEGAGLGDPPPDPEGDCLALALAALAEILSRAEEAASRAARSADPHSPWQTTSGWRLNARGRGRLSFGLAGERQDVTVAFEAAGYRLGLAGREIAATARLEAPGLLVAELDGRRRRVAFSRARGALTLFLGAEVRRLELIDPIEALAGAEGPGGALTAPMPGRVLQVPVAEGAEVSRGALLVLLEAMKMEHAIVAPADGRVAQLHVAAGDLVEEGVQLVDFQAAGE